MTLKQELDARQKQELLELKLKLLKQIKRSVYVYRVDCGGCNGCEIEIFAAITPLFDAERFGIKVVGSPRHADVVVFTGPMTRPMRMPAIRAYQAAPEPKVVVAYGACGCSGGIFHDSYGVWGGADSVFPVDLYIPGCPPTPCATIHGFAVALGLLHQKMKGEHYVEGAGAAARLKFPEVPIGLRKEIEREARRLCGYWHGKRIAEQYLEFLLEKDLQRIERKLDAFLNAEKDPRLVEVYLKIHRLYVAEMERSGQQCPERLNFSS
ncbi:MAG: NADH-quinone oxidoreductase subunit B family protein [Bacillota bacterium]|nr:NADH-quinone oxidoreductase subunit B family protein [Bacillota bacterium]